MVGVFFETQQQQGFLADKNIALPNAKIQHLQMWKKEKKQNPNFIEVQSFAEDLTISTGQALSRIQVFRSYIIALTLVAAPPPLASLPPQSPQAAVQLSFLQLKLAPAVAVSVSMARERP